MDAPSLLLPLPWKVVYFSAFKFVEMTDNADVISPCSRLQNALCYA